MRIVYFVHAIASCWNNGNAHFLRGIGAELMLRGHDVLFAEPMNGWSETNLVNDHGRSALGGFARAYPGLHRIQYDVERADLAPLTEGADLVIVHEWNAPAVVNALGRMRRGGEPFLLLFHDTHHRALTDAAAMGAYDLADYDGVLAFGEVLSEIYRRRGWGDRVWTWHEAADVSLFYPRTREARAGDVAWVGNWGDEERTVELEEFLLRPVEALGLRTNIFGVRYPECARAALAERGIAYRGWLPNHAVPDVFGQHGATVHIPRRPYAETLAGIPTIRVFEALACGIPLVSAPWEDCEGLFPDGCYLVARNGEDMGKHLRAIFADADLARDLRERGLATIRNRHTCRHRVDQLLSIVHRLRDRTAPARGTEAA